MKIEVVENNWVETVKRKDIYLSIRGKAFEEKSKAERDSQVCMLIVLYHLGYEYSFNEDGEFVNQRLGYEEVSLLLDLELVVPTYEIQERYARATRTDLSRVEQIMNGFS